MNELPLRITLILILASLSAVGTYAIRRVLSVAPPVPPLPSTLLRGTDPIPGVRGICADTYSAVCKQTPAEWRDPTGAVIPDAEATRQTTELLTKILSAYPKWSEAQAHAELVRRIYTPGRVRRILEAYRWVERSLESLIESQPKSVFNQKEKDTLRARLRATKLELPPPASVYADRPGLFTRTDVIYERALDGRTRMRIGGAYVLAAQSWFNMVFTLAHELAHAIDPCEVRAAGLALPAYDRLSACLLSQGLIAARSTRSECGKNDQLGETFADWMAVQVTSQVLEKFREEFKAPTLASAAANSVRDLCEQDEEYEPDSQFHPEPRIRIERIFGQHPRIRQILGCPALRPSLPRYCGFEGITAAPWPAGPEKPAH